MKRRSRWANKCTVCKKNISQSNKSGLCGHHYRLKHNKLRRQLLKSKRLCIECGKKVEPTILYPAGDTVLPITNYYIRCYNCRMKQAEYNKKKKVTTK